jgi:hypothetical protein
MKKTILLFLFSITLTRGYGQTTEDRANLEKYWKYRQQLRERFMRIGTDQGESIPMSCIIPGYKYGPGETGSILHWRDSNISLGYYLIVLATEYELLINSGEDTEPTLNELYYALSAINRMDVNAEMYLSEGDNQPSPDDLNGLFLRDDVTYGIVDNWLGDPPIPNAPIVADPTYIGDVGNPNNMRGDFNGWSGYGPSATPTTFNDGNVISLDQITTILLGLRFVVQFVDDQVIQPTAADTPMNLRQEAKDIIWRIADNMNDTSEPIDNEHEWMIKKWDGQLVKSGPSCVFASYPIYKLIEYTHGSVEAEKIRQPGDIVLEFAEEDVCNAILGGGFGDGESLLGPMVLGELFGLLLFSDINLAADIEEYVTNHCILPPDRSASEGPLPIKLNIDEIGDLWRAFSEQNVPYYVQSQEVILLGDLDFDYWTQNGGLFGLWNHHTMDNIFLPLSLGSEDQLSDDYAQSANKITDDDNVHITFELATLSGIWDLDYINERSKQSHFQHIGLMNAVLHNNSSPTSGMVQEDYRELLSLAPCVGPWSNPHVLTEAAPEWASANRLFHQGIRNTGSASTDEDGNLTADWEYRGYSNGLDYMVYYNLYQLLWGEQFSYKSNTEKCECVVEFTNEISFANVLDVKPKFSDYEEMGILTEKFLSHDLEITSNTGELNLHADLIVCNETDILASGDETELHLTNGAELNIFGGHSLIVRSGNKVVLDGNSSLITSDNGLSKITLEPGAELVVNNSNFLVNTQTEIFVGAGAKLRFVDGLFTVMPGKPQSTIYLAQDAELQVLNSTFVTNSNFLVEGHLAHIDFSNSYVTLQDNSKISLGATSLDINNTQLVLNNSNILALGSEINHNSGKVLIKNSGFIKLYELATYRYDFMDNLPATIHIEGENSFVSFELGKLQIAEGKIFEPKHDNVPSGFIEFKGSGDQEIIMGENAVIKLIGDGPNDELLRINDWADMWNVNNGFGELYLKDCKVNLSNHGAIWTDMKFNAINVNFEDAQPEASLNGGNIQVWYSNTCSLLDCSFNHARLNTIGSHVALSGCNFHFQQSGYKCQEGHFLMNNCYFEGSHMESKSLDQYSSMTQCTFENPDFTGQIGASQSACYYDESLVEVKLNNCTFRNGLDGVSKEGGQLSLKCCLFQQLNDKAVTFANGFLLNMSSNTLAGYNNFDQVGTCIYLSNAEYIDLYSGYNNLAGFTDCCICGTLNWKCLGNPCDLHISADYNYWGAPQNTFPPSPQPVGPYNPEMQEVVINLYTLDAPPTCYVISPNGQAVCFAHFTDHFVSVPTGCGTGNLVPHHGRRSLMTSNETIQHYAAPRTENNVVTHELRDLIIDADNPQISTTSFVDISLDSALIFAASQLEIVDSSGNNYTAVELFHEILTSPLDRTNPEIRWKMEWGRSQMKTAVELMFQNSQLFQANNLVSFETPVNQYVNVLNAMTDTVLTDSTYKSQFYLELDKGQLFRTLGNPLMAKHIYVHLDDCQLDSVEQSLLNNWRQQVDLELSLANQFMVQDISPDSISFSVNTSAYTPITSSAMSDFYFGVWIDSPTSVTFVNCGNNPVYRSAWSSNNSVSIYPNPTQGSITIKVNALGIYALDIFDNEGRSIYKTQLNLQESNTANLQLPSSVAKGNYLIKLENQGGIYLDRLIKQ